MISIIREILSISQEMEGQNNLWEILKRICSKKIKPTRGRINVSACTAHAPIIHANGMDVYTSIMVTVQYHNYYTYPSCLACIHNFGSSHT